MTRYFLLLAPVGAWEGTAALELESQMVEAAADHGWYWGESCSGMNLAVITGQRGSPTGKSWISFCVEMARVEFGIGSLWSCPTMKV